MNILNTYADGYDLEKAADSAICPSLHRESRMMWGQHLDDAHCPGCSAAFVHGYHVAGVEAGPVLGVGWGEAYGCVPAWREFGHELDPDIGGVHGMVVPGPWRQCPVCAEQPAAGRWGPAATLVRAGELQVSADDAVPGLCCAPAAPVRLVNQAHTIRGSQQKRPVLRCLPGQASGASHVLRDQPDRQAEKPLY
jgi:hypothetical protein